MTSQLTSPAENEYASTNSIIQERREKVFLVLAGFFLCSMTLLNVIGITRFVELGPMQLAIGVLPYPITFLCTDVISELYGKKRANFLVTVGLVLNGFILLVFYVGSSLPSVAAAAQPPWQTLELVNQIGLPSGESTGNSIELFQLLYACTVGAAFASMIAYVIAQYVDVHVFHLLKRKTKGKHLWIRNNFSTLTSQCVDSVVVISITFGAAYFAGEISLTIILGLMLSNYLFKMFAALIDTPFIYLTVHKLRSYLQLQQFDATKN